MTGRDDSFVEFATAARVRLRNTAYLLCGDWHYASDLVQDGLIRVYVAWPRIQRNGSELAYARKAVVSAFIDAKRKKSSGELPAEPDPDRAAADDVATTVTERQALMTALATLPRQQRACIVLRYFEDLSVHDTAEALGCPEGTVKSHTARGLESLKSIVAATTHTELVVAGEVR